MRRDAKVTRIGLDCHRKFSNVTARSGEGKVVWRQKLDHADRDRLRDALCEWPQGTPVILEGTFGWGWLSDELVAAGLVPYLANSKKVANWRAARGLAKCNRVDADLLSELWDQQPRWWEVWLAPPEIRGQREWLRYRMGLVGIQTMLKNRIHAVLHRHGIVNQYSDLFGVKGRFFLKDLLSEDGDLPPSTRKVLGGLLWLLDQVRRLIAAATREIHRFVHRTPDARRLRTLPGVSYILAYTILAEIGRIERFKGSRQLAAYSLLAPLANETGESDDGSPLGRHVGFAGRRTLKWAFIEAARTAIRKDPRMRAVYDRRTNGGKRDRNRGSIAVAHALCKATHAVLKHEVDYSPEPPPRPGTKANKKQPGLIARPASKKTRKKSRPGTGQPVTAMVTASDSSRL